LNDTVVSFALLLTVLCKFNSVRVKLTMTTDFIYLGPVPSEEPCEQAAPEKPIAAGYEESKAYRDQLRRLHKNRFGCIPEAQHCRLKVQSFDSELGSYYEVVAVFDADNKAAIDAAFWLDANTPEYWDAEAKKQLGR
jgi:hypothetical protein